MNLAACNLKKFSPPRRRKIIQFKFRDPSERADLNKEKFYDFIDQPQGEFSKN